MEVRGATAGALVRQRRGLCCSGTEEMKADAWRWVCIREREENLYSRECPRPWAQTPAHLLRGKEERGQRKEEAHTTDRGPTARHASLLPLRPHPDV